MRRRASAAHLADGPALAEEFVDQGGVVELILAGDGAKPSLQAYALQALRTALSYEIGTQRLLRAGGAAKLVQLYSADDATAKVVEIALEILFMLCGRADGFKIVHSATLSVARARGEQSYRRLLELIGECDDLVVKTNALMLLNQLIQSAPDRKAKERLLLKLSRRLGVDRLLSSQLHLQEPDFRQQLRVYQQVAGMQIPGSWEQADLFRLGASGCRRAAGGARELQVFETKRPMAKMLLREFGNMREAARLADAQGALAPFASTAPRLVGSPRWRRGPGACRRAGRTARTRRRAGCRTSSLAGDEVAAAAGAPGRSTGATNTARGERPEVRLGPCLSATARAAAAAAAAVAAAGLAAVAAAAAAAAALSGGDQPARRRRRAGRWRRMAPPAPGRARRRRRRCSARPARTPPGAPVLPPKP